MIERADGGRADPDSRARTHLANERTFLAWFRTGLTTIALGLAAGQFLARDVVSGVPIVTLLGVFLVIVGVVRYVSQRRRIEHRTFRPADRAVLISAGAAIAAGVLAVVFLWVLPS
jgi:putative membrane protein